MFTRKDEEVYKPIHLAIAVSNGKERIVVGNELEVDRCFSGVEATVYYNEERKLGSFLLDFDDPEDDMWLDARAYLQEELECRKDMKGRGDENAPPSELEEMALKILVEKSKTGNPVYIYMALRIWFEYMRSLKCVASAFQRWSTKQGEKIRGECVDSFVENSVRAIYPVVRRRHSDGEKQVKGTAFLLDNPLYAWPKEKKGSTMEAVVVYSSDRLQTEYAFTLYSLLGVKAYYANKLKEYNLKIAQCVVCGRDFVSARNTGLLCGAKACVVESKKRNREKRRQDLNKRLEEDYFNSQRQRWVHEISRLKKNEPENKVALERLLAAHETFKKEARKMRKEYGEGRLTDSELVAWFNKQAGLMYDAINPQ